MEIKDAAIEKLKKILKEVNKGSCLRIFMAEGCCGPSVAMDITTVPDKDDKEITVNDFKIHVHKDAMLPLANAVIDCKEGEIMITGLPSQDDSCGCGH